MMGLVEKIKNEKKFVMDSFKNIDVPINPYHKEDDAGFLSAIVGGGVAVTALAMGSPLVALGCVAGGLASAYLSNKKSKKELLEMPGNLIKKSVGLAKRAYKAIPSVLKKTKDFLLWDVCGSVPYYFMGAFGSIFLGALTHDIAGKTPEAAVAGISLGLLSLTYVQSRFAKKRRRLDEFDYEKHMKEGESEMDLFPYFKNESQENYGSSKKKSCSDELFKEILLRMNNVEVKESDNSTFWTEDYETEIVQGDEELHLGGYRLMSAIDKFHAYASYSKKDTWAFNFIDLDPAQSKIVYKVLEKKYKE